MWLQIICFWKVIKINLAWKCSITLNWPEGNRNFQCPTFPKWAWVAAGNTSDQVKAVVRRGAPLEPSRCPPEAAQLAPPQPKRLLLTPRRPVAQLPPPSPQWFLRKLRLPLPKHPIKIRYGKKNCKNYLQLPDPSIHFHGSSLWPL